ncbi:MAG: hypothetical protein IIA64_11990 [Planctomycetes bacterium]|nr:hypothetical protein [Planctomycetota bacterium]
MKRRLGKLVVFLLLGAIINVAVAWGILAATAWFHFIDYPEQQMGAWPPDRPEWEVELLSYAGHASLVSDDYVNGYTDYQLYRPIRAWLPSWALCRSETPAVVNPPHSGALVEHATGWPLLALHSRYRWTIGTNPRWMDRVDLIGPGIVVSTSRQYRVAGLPFVLPLRPIWLGFAINTIFYAALLWLLTLGPFTARRMIRRKRGRCLKCGYDLRGADHEACPECGVSLPQPPALPGEPTGNR